MQGFDGVDLEMNFNGSQFGSHDDEFSDVVCVFLLATNLSCRAIFFKLLYAVSKQL